MALAWGLAVVGGASAQTTSLPGIVISTPPSGPAPGPAQTTFPPFGRPPEAAPPPPAAPAPKAKTAAAIKPKPKTTAAADTAGSGRGGGGQSIIMLVNDEPITALDVQQRAQLNALSADIGSRASANMKALVQSESTQKRFRAMVEQIVKENQSTKSREQIMAMIEARKTQFAQQLQQEAIASARASVLPGAKKGSLEELIEERIKLQEAKRLNVNVEDSQIDDIIKSMAEKNKMTPNQFADHLKKMGADVAAMKARFKATLSWNEVVRRRFSSQVTVSQREIDKFAAAGTTGEDEVELQLQRITLPVVGKMDQKVLTERFRDADRMRQSFGGCKTASAAAAKVAGAKFEDLGVRKPSTLNEPLRSHLLAARDGEMVPPNIADGGIELYAVCSRKVVKADDKRRTEISDDLRQKEFEIMAKGHLRNLRQEAHIECRAPECKK
ncbi:MAG: SurA N-terminal domain-containing protein [Hyphomicrobiaceae bacterium]